MQLMREKVSYLKGLVDGLKMDETTNEGRLFKAIINAMDDFAVTVDDVVLVQEQISEDLAEVENNVFGDYGYEQPLENTIYSEMECPYCHEKIQVDEELLDSDNNTIICPSCTKKIDVEWENKPQDVNEQQIQ